MKYWYQKPHPSLRDLIRTVLVIEGFSKGGDTHLPLVTNGMPALLCHTVRKGERDSIQQITLYGTSVSSNRWKATKNSTLIFYFFKPFVLPCLFDLPAARLARQPVPLASWDRAKSKEMTLQLKQAVSSRKKIHCLDQLLVEQQEKTNRLCRIIQEATDQLMTDTGTSVLQATLNQVKQHPRTFQRMFKKYVGITPSHYRRICQFEQSFTHLRTGDFDSLTDVAYANGFADQSHFTRSFREFTATTPANYLQSGLKRKRL